MVTKFRGLKLKRPLIRLNGPGSPTVEAPLPNGIYTFRVESSANNEVILDETADVYARVLEVSSENGDSVLVLSGNISVAVTGVTALREAKSS
jgi:flagellar basal-body rod modification protein FlgD